MAHLKPFFWPLFLKAKAFQNKAFSSKRRVIWVLGIELHVAFYSTCEKLTKRLENIPKLTHRNHGTTVYFTYPFPRRTLECTGRYSNHIYPRPKRYEKRKPQKWRLQIIVFFHDLSQLVVGMRGWERGHIKRGPWYSIASSSGQNVCLSERK